MSNTNNSESLVDTPSKSFAWMSIIYGLIGWAAAFALTLERIHVSANPNATLSCDLNVFISCKSVMLTKQAALLGFPNPLIGLAAFVAPIFVGFAVLAGARLKQWFWRIYMVGISMGFIFVLFLFSQSTYVIHVLCPYCMLAWIAMIPLFWKTLLWAGAEGVIDVPVRLLPTFIKGQDYVWLYTIGTEFLAALAIVISFWSSWPSMFR